MTCVVSWDYTEQVSCYSGYWLGVSQHKPFVYTSPADNSATLNEKREVDL